MELFTTLIDVQRLIFNCIWIIGASIIMASLSLHHYYAQESGVRLRSLLGGAGFQLCLWVGLTLVSIGFAGNANTFWEQITWLGLTLLNVVQLFFALRTYQTAEAG